MALSTSDALGDHNIVLVAVEPGIDAGDLDYILSAACLEATPPLAHVIEFARRPGLHAVNYPDPSVLAALDAGRRAARKDNQDA